MSEEETTYISHNQGNVNIILTSPHGGLQKLDSVKVRTAPGACNIQDSNTNSILISVFNHLDKLSGGTVKPYYVMGLCHRKYCDLNRNPNSAFEEPDAKPYYDKYHGTIKTYINEMKNTFPNRRHLLLIDIHGQSSIVDCVMRGTQNGNTVKRLTERFGEAAVIGDKSLFGQLNSKKGIKIYPDNTGSNRWLEHKDYNGGWTVCYYSGYRKWPDDKFDLFIDAIQVEIGIDFRKSPDTMEVFSQHLAESILTFYKEFLEKEIQ